MSYSDLDRSGDQGSPLLLFEFIRGGTTFRFTNNAVSVSHGGHVWAPSAVSTSGVTQSEDVHKNTVQLSFPRDVPFALDFLRRPTFVQAVTTVTIYRGHFQTSGISSIVFWKGRVSSATGTRATIVLECEPLFTSLRLYGLRARYQKTCRHPLYGQGCNLVADNYAKGATTDGYSGPRMFTLKNVNVEPDELIGGMVQIPDGSFHHIIDQRPGYFIVSAPAVSLVEEIDSNGVVPLSVYPGCDHTLETCHKKFSNHLNFGGFPWIPTKNPFEGSIN